MAPFLKRPSVNFSVLFDSLYILSEYFITFSKSSSPDGLLTTFCPNTPSSSKTTSGNERARL
jgi:hypothetical protein